MTMGRADLEKIYEPTPRPWWWKLPRWLPGQEARRLERLSLEALQERRAVGSQLWRLEKAAVREDLSEKRRARLQRRIRATERLREALLDTERSLATRRQTLLLATTARATWAAALAALAGLALALLQLLRPR